MGITISSKPHYQYPKIILIINNKIIILTFNIALLNLFILKFHFIFN